MSLDPLGDLRDGPINWTAMTEEDIILIIRLADRMFEQRILRLARAALLRKEKKRGAWS